MWRRRWVRWGLAALGLLATVVVARALMLRPVAPGAGPAVALPPIDENAAVERFAAALRIATVSIKDGRGDPARFVELHALLTEQFPTVHATLLRETVNEHSIIFRWPGSDPTLAPLLLLAHLDVVPVEAGTDDEWGQPPFSGAIVDGEVWGRGAMDDKASVVAILEAVEALLHSGFRPRRTVVLAFGHDEEVGGTDGAMAIAERFERAGERFGMILDEGGAVVKATIPGVKVPVALVGVAEKGYASLVLSVRGEGGHSSMPAAGGSIARLARAVRLVDEHQMGARIDGPTEQMLQAIGPHMPLAMRLGVANLWLLRPALAAIMLSQPPSAASVRTTTAPTMFDAGTAENVLPQQARAVVNFRILPGDTVASVITHVKAVVSDPAIDVRCLDRCWEPSEPSSIDTEGFVKLQEAILHTFPEAVVAPYLVVGATDAHHYQHLGEGTYRFLPLVMVGEQRSRLHGTGERLEVAVYLRSIRFYLEVLLRVAA